MRDILLLVMALLLWIP